MDVATLIGLGVAVLLLGLLFARARKKPDEIATAPRKSELEVWIEEELARELGKKLGREAEGMLGVLRGDPDPDAVTAIEDAVKSVKLKYAKMAEEGELELRVEVAFEDGATSSGSRRVKHEELPQSIQEELLRTGASYAFRDWHFPWYGPDRGWSN